jgi:hypothetical protein
MSLKKTIYKDMYEVEKIIKKKVEDGKSYYLIKWVGYSESQNTWEPYDNLKNVREMVIDYEINNIRNSTQDNMIQNKQFKECKMNSTNNSSLERSRSPKKIDNKGNLDIRQLFKNSEKTKINNSLIAKSDRIINDSNDNSNLDNDKKTITRFSKSLQSEKKSFPYMRYVSELMIDNQNMYNPDGFENDSLLGDMSSDIPKKVISLKSIKGNLFLLTDWEPRSCGLIPFSSLVKYETIREKCPELIIDFYEARLINNNLKLSFDY